MKAVNGKRVLVVAVVLAALTLLAYGYARMRTERIEWREMWDETYNSATALRIRHGVARAVGTRRQRAFIELKMLRHRSLMGWSVERVAREADEYVSRYPGELGCSAAICYKASAQGWPMLFSRDAATRRRGSAILMEAAERLRKEWPGVYVTPAGLREMKAEDRRFVLEFPEPYFFGLRWKRTLPAFHVRGIGGEDLSPGRFRGKVLLIDFWATWCRPCVAELRVLKRLYGKYHDRGLEIIGISADSDAMQVKGLKTWLAGQGVKWHQYCSGKGWKDPVFALYDVRGIPSIFVADRDGTFLGEHRGGGLEELVEALFASGS